MTRFIEQKRIEQAIKHQNNDVLLWALSYCEMRLGLSNIKESEKHWNKQIHNVKEILNISKRE